MKRRFNLIVLFMSISLLGIIFIQTLWVRHAFQLEASRFDKSVYEAILESIDQWGRYDRFSFIDQKLDLPPPPPPPVSAIQTPPPAPITLPEPEPTFDLDSVHTLVRSKRVVTHIYGNDSDVVYFDGSYLDTLYGNKQLDYEIHWAPAPRDIAANQADQQDIERWLVISGARDSLETLLSEKKWQEEQEKVKLIEEKLVEFNKNMEEWVVEYSFDPDKMFFTMNNANFDSLIGHALNSRGIQLPFYYQMIQTTEDSTQVLHATKNAPPALANAYKANLFPDNFFQRNMYLLVSFPTKNTYLYRSLTFLIAGSVAFTLIMLTTFWFTIFYMLRQKKMSQIKTDFINNMTHEFKTPIATIGLATDALQSPKVMGHAEPTNYYLNMIRKENKRMNHQVEKVLQMALIERGNLQLEREWVDAHEVIEHTVATLQLLAKQKEGRILTSLKASCSVLLADEVHLANLMNNLLDNAIKYTEKPPEIMVETYNQGNHLVIRVADNGVGMSKEVLHHIFDQFYRKPSGNIHNIKGFGLGLSYVKAIVDSHEGTITVNSEPGHGSIFTLTFNCQKS